MSENVIYVFIPSPDEPFYGDYEYIRECSGGEMIHNYMPFDDVPKRCMTHNWYRYENGKYKKATKSEVNRIKCLGG